jgi:pyruvate carboxylase subunit B
MRYEVEVGGALRRIDIRREAGRLVMTVDGRRRVLDAARVDARTLSLLIEDGERSLSREVSIDHDPAGLLRVRVGAVVVPVGLNGPRRRTPRDSGASGTGAQRLVAPMPGKIVRLLVEAGAHVSVRQPLIVIEAMKMENELRAGSDGIVADIAVRPGQSVEAGALLMIVTEGQAS